MKTTASADDVDPPAELRLLYETGSKETELLKASPDFDKWALQQFRAAAAGRCTLARARAHVRAHADRMLKEIAEEIERMGNTAPTMDRMLERARRRG